MVTPMKRIWFMHAPVAPLHGYKHNSAVIMNAAPPRSESLRLLLTAVKDSPLPPQIVIRLCKTKQRCI